MAEKIYNRFKHRSATGATAIGTSTIKALLLETTAAGAYDPDLNTVTDLLAVVGVAEMIATNYARKTATLTGTEDDANDRENIALTALTWTALGVAGGGDGSIVAVVFYDEGGGTDATRYLISHHDTGFPLVTNGGDVTLGAGDVVRLT